jgi:hypothetical protein
VGPQADDITDDAKFKKAIRGLRSATENQVSDGVAVIVSASASSSVSLSRLRLA